MPHAPLDKYQKAAMGLMSLMVLLTFALTSLQAALWQSSNMLVGAVLPAVVVDLTNEERGDLAVKPLTRNATLDAAAQLKAEHMAENSYFAHYAPDGTTPWHWFDAAGYTYAHAGENLAIHFSDSSEVVEAWMDSPTHRANIVDQKFTEIGVGTARGRLDGHRTVFVVQLFGTPAVTVAANTAPTPTPAPVEIQTPAPAQTDLVEVFEDESPEESEVAAAEIDTVTTVPEELLVVENTAPAFVPVEPIPVDLSEASPETVDMAPTEVRQEAESSPFSEMLVLESASLPETNPVTEALQVRQSMVSTSSGLAVANTAVAAPQQPVSFLALATQPNTVMQVIYTLIALAVFFLLIVAFVNEFRHAHPIQMGYSVAMLLLMTGLYWAHTVLTEGAIVV